MTSPPDDRWLWSREGPPDAEVERLERLLAPLAHSGAAPVPRPPHRRIGWRLPAAAALLLLGAGGALLVDAVVNHGALAPRGAPPIAVVADGGTAVAAGAWVEAVEVPREVRFGDLGRVTLEPGSRLRVAAAGRDVTRFFLERGRLEAFVSAAARPRFFQVDTAAARCVDLGCRYTLEVDADGTSRVRVSLGQVAFETPDREVYVPAGAACTARPGAGPGTPRFEDASPAVAAAVDAYDAAPRGSPERAARARDLLAAVAADEDALPAWHLLADPAAEVAGAALDLLRSRYGVPEGWAAPEGRLTREDLAAWRDHLDPRW